MGLKSSSLRVVRRSSDQRGVTLLEMLVAMLIMVMVSVMLYSVLNVGINFSRKGEIRARQAGRERAFLELLHRQVQGARFDQKQKKAQIDSSGHQLLLVTTAPLLNRDLGMVMAIYLYEPKDDTLYYTEKKDFYNADYRESYQAKPREMLALMREAGAISLNYASDEGGLKVTCRGREHFLAVRCWQSEAGV